jgi:hypothetical protein
MSACLSEFLKLEWRLCTGSCGLHPLHEVISAQDGMGNASLFDPPLSLAIPLREANGGVISDFPRQFHDALDADLLGLSEKVLLVAPLVWRTSRHEEQRIDTFERGGNALRALEVENCGLDSCLPKGGRLGLTVNACTCRDLFRRVV